VYRGAYHFFSADADPGAQARHFLNGIGTLQPTDLPPTLDLEWDFRRRSGAWSLDPNGEKHDFWSDLTPRQIIDRVTIWLDQVERASGRIPVIYTNHVWWMARVGDESMFARLRRYPIWIADYSARGRGQENPRVPNSHPWAIWQFTEKGNLSQGGIVGSVDVSIFKGMKQQFRQALGLPAN
jgi:lysozyme